MLPSAQVAPEDPCEGNILMGRSDHNRNMDSETVGTSDTVDEETDTVENRDGSTRAGGRAAGQTSLPCLWLYSKARVEAVGPASAEQMLLDLHTPHTEEWLGQSSHHTQKTATGPPQRNTPGNILEMVQDQVLKVATGSGFCLCPCGHSIDIPVPTPWAASKHPSPHFPGCPKGLGLMANPWGCLTGSEYLSASHLRPG